VGQPADKEASVLRPSRLMRSSDVRDAMSRHRRDGNAAANTWRDSSIAQHYSAMSTKCWRERSRNGRAPPRSVSAE
jgi:hypothetical protein